MLKPCSIGEGASEEFRRLFETIPGYRIARIIGITPAGVSLIKKKGAWPNTPSTHEKYIDRIIKYDPSFTKEGLLKKGN